MASPPPPSSSPSLRWILPWFAVRPHADACFQCSRHENPTKGILETLKICDAYLEQDAKQSETWQEDTGFRSEAMSYCFILDSGATCHAVGDKALLSSSTTVTPAGSPAAYKARDGRLLTVAGAGIIESEGFRIPNVLCVPGLFLTGLILVSVQQLAEERDYLVMFGGGQCYVKDPRSGKIVGKGQLHDDDGLYHLEFLRIPPRAADGMDSSVA